MAERRQPIHSASWPQLQRIISGSWALASAPLDGAQCARFMRVATLQRRRQRMRILIAPPPSVLASCIASSAGSRIARTYPARLLFLTMATLDMLDNLAHTLLALPTSLSSCRPCYRGWTTLDSRSCRSLMQAPIGLASGPPRGECGSQHSNRSEVSRWRLCSSAACPHS